MNYMKNRILSMLALLLTAATGAWAQSGTSLTSTDGKVWTLASMPAYNVILEVEYKTDTEVTLTYDGEAVPTDGVKGFLNFESEFIKKLAVAVNEAGTTTAVSGATVTYTSSDPTVVAFKSGESYVATGALADIAFLKEGSATLTINYAGSDDYAKSSATLKVTVTEKTYTIEMADDAENWTVDPAEAKASTEIKATYKGKLKVKSVKAVEKVDGIDLAKVTADLELKDGDVVFGTLDGVKQPYKISIADGATVTLNGASINGTNSSSYNWAGLTCAGDATIILADGSTNTVKGFYEEYPGIYVQPENTLTIKGTGQLSASSNGYGCGIGGGWSKSSGNIAIEGGDITAKGGKDAAGIGGGKSGSCGAVTISGGEITATGKGGAGIGAGDNATCGDITITGGTIDATGFNGAAGIGTGPGESGKSTCGNILISGGTVSAAGSSYYEYGGGAGIGAGFAYGSNTTCGTITITSGVTKVIATKGIAAANSIGAGTTYGESSSTCGTVTIEDGANVIQE